MIDASVTPDTIIARRVGDAAQIVIYDHASEKVAVVFYLSYKTVTILHHSLGEICVGIRKEQGQ